MCDIYYLYALNNIFRNRRTLARGGGILWEKPGEIGGSEGDRCAGKRGNGCLKSADWNEVAMNKKTTIEWAKNFNQ